MECIARRCEVATSWTSVAYEAGCSMVVSALRNLHVANAEYYMRSGYRCVVNCCLSRTPTPHRASPHLPCGSFLSWRTWLH